MSVKRLVPLNNFTSNAAPAVARDGDMYLDTVSGRIQVFLNGGWKALAYLVDIDPGSLSIVDGGYYNTLVFDGNIDGGYYNTTSFADILDAGALT